MSDKIGEFYVSDTAESSQALRQRLEEEGYLFFRGVQNRERLLALRREMTNALMAAGWLVEGTDPMEGIARLEARGAEGDPQYSRGYAHVYKLEAFHRAGHWPEVRALMAKVVGEPVLPHPQKIARLWFPQYTDHTTPIHQDYVHFQGSYQTYTFWAPVGDCPLELGGLAVLPGSHKINKVREHHFSLGAGSLAIDTSELEGEWLSTNYAAGDCLVFPSLTVHQALPNLTKDRLRISLDNRFQNAQEPIAEHMLEPHMGNLTQLDWEKIYAGWKDEKYKYYWRDFDLEVMPRQTQWGEKGLADALELGRGGDPHALHFLRRIATREPDSEPGQKAAVVLGQVEKAG